MQDMQPKERPRLLHRPSTRRALLAGAATAAAGGTAAAIVGFAANTRADSNNGKFVVPGTATDQAKTAADALNQPIEHPKRRAAHLLRRAGWGGTQAQIDEFSLLSREDAASRLIDYETVDTSGLNARIEKAAFNLTTPGRGLDGKRPPMFRDMQRWWLTRMSYTARPLEERMTNIWHGLLTTQLSQIGGQRGKLMVQQNELFRTHALGQDDPLLQAVS